MILDEGCAERGCPMHDSRETKGVVFIRKEWVGLTGQERNALLHLTITHSAIEFGKAIEDKLKEKNA